MRIYSRVVFAALLAVIFSFSPRFVSSSFAQPTPISAGDILVANAGKGTIHHYSASGEDLHAFAEGLNSPSWITADQFGNIYVSEQDVQDPPRVPLRVIKFSPAGDTLLTITTDYHPAGIRVGADGTIYVVDFFGGKINRYSPSGAVLPAFALTSLLTADFMAFDATGNLYVAGTSLLNAEVVRSFSPTGAVLGDFVEGFSAASGLAFDADGNLHVASFNIVEKFSPSGLPGQPPAQDQGMFVLGGPEASFSGIAFDLSGNLYIANHAQDNILKFSPATNDLAVFASTDLDNPRDLVIVPVSPTPTVKTECKDGGWQSFDPFKNQGDCIQFINTGK